MSERVAVRVVTHQSECCATTDRQASNDSLGITHRLDGIGQSSPLIVKAVVVCTDVVSAASEIGHTSDGLDADGFADVDASRAVLGENRSIEL